MRVPDFASDDADVEEVFDTTGRPPAGWMHALFDGGPFANDVGRCVPGPPPPDPLVVGETTYQLRTVGSWSDPSDPIAVYGLTRECKHPQLCQRVLVPAIVLASAESLRVGVVSRLAKPSAAARNIVINGSFGRVLALDRPAWRWHR
jgi:hypothetical protein